MTARIDMMGLYPYCSGVDTSFEGIFYFGFIAEMLVSGDFP